MIMEKTIETRCRKFVKGEGGYAIKLQGLGCAGLPDRLILMPGGKIMFVEFKQPGKKPSALQDVWLARLSRIGFTAFWCYDYDYFVDRYKKKAL